MAKRNDLIRIGFLIHDVSRLRHHVFDRHAQPLAGVTRSQWWVLIYLTRNDERGMTQIELARLLDVGKVALSKMIDRLERKGLVTRTANTLDRRSKRVALTRKGADIVAQMESVALELSARIMAGIPTAKYQELLAMLLTMKRNLVAMEAPAEVASGAPGRTAR